ncbi:hypothetical protein HDU88_007438 [Geranomyces variabilis]|nr:hypothetical protein HDU88_007438 [Geranomyces variabilis]
MTTEAASKWLQFSKQAAEDYTPHPALASDTIGDGNLHRSGVNFRPAFTAAFNAEAYNNMMSKRPTLRGGGGPNPVAAPPIRPVTAPAPNPTPAMMTKQQLAAHKARIVLDDAPRAKTVFIGGKRKDDPTSGTTSNARPDGKAATPTKPTTAIYTFSSSAKAATTIASTTASSSPSSAKTASATAPRSSSAQPASSAPGTPVRTFVKGKLVAGPAGITAAPAPLKQPTATDVAPPDDFKIWGAADRQAAQAIRKSQSDQSGDAEESARAVVPPSGQNQSARIGQQVPSSVQATPVKSRPSAPPRTAPTMTDDGFLQIANARPSALKKAAVAAAAPVAAPASSEMRGRAASETPSVSDMTQQFQDLDLTEKSTKPDPKTDLAADNDSSNAKPVTTATPGSVSGSWTIIEESLPAASATTSSTTTFGVSLEAPSSAPPAPAAVVTTSESLIDLSTEWDSPKLAPKAAPTRVFESPAVRSDVQKEIDLFWSKAKRAPVGATASAPNLFGPTATPAPMPFATMPISTAQQQLLLQRYHAREAQLKRELQLQLEKEWNEMCRLLQSGTPATRSGSALFGLDQMQ